jgi:hypothetical protein
MKLSDYILLPREQRIAHIDLTTECVTRKKWRKSTFLDFHGLEDDIPNWKHARIERCHLCECHSRNGCCVNPHHVYIGTAKENAADRPQEYLVESGRRLGSRPRTQETRRKMSEGARKRTDQRNRQPITLRRISDEEIFHFPSQKEAAEALNLSRSGVSHLMTGKKKVVKGFQVHNSNDRIE